MQNFFNFIRENLRLLLGALVVTLVGILLISFILSKQSPKVLVSDQIFRVTIAKSEKEKQIGLSRTEQINEDQGMLFVFDTPDYHSFWMKEMKFPIDIIYISGDKVVTVIENAKPPGDVNENIEIYQPEEKSDKVLEVNAGLAKKHNIKKGSLVKIENL